MASGRDVIDFIHEFCRVPEGPLVGRPMILEPFQQAFILEVYDNPHGTRQGILSIARKNGKSGLIAAIMLAHLVGPAARQNSQIISGARSRKQAAVVFNLAVKMVRLNPDLAKLIRIVPSLKHMHGLLMNTEYDALSAEAGTAHGLSPALAIIDEMGQVRGPYDAFVEAIETAQGAYDDALELVISTQAPTDADMLSIRIDYAQTAGDKTMVCHVHDAPKNAALDDPEAWAAANPALGKFRSEIEIANKAAEALKMPSVENSFRNLYLNQRIDMNSPFVSRLVWDANGGPVEDEWGDAAIYAGLDLSSVHDLTAFVPMAWVDGAWNVKPTFWLPGDGLREKALSDRVPYDTWAKQGFLNTTPGKAIEYEYVANWLRGFVDSHNVAKIAFDRWGMKHLVPWLLRAGFSDTEIETLFEDFGQGFQSMSPALRDLESALLSEKVRHGKHPVLAMCAANAVVSTDPAGGRKLNKAKAAGRIDGMVALTMAFGVAPVLQEVTPEYAIHFV